jgi:hypothetical protein
MADTSMPPPWLKQAAFALHAAVDEDWPTANRIVTQIARTHGVNAIPNVLLAFIDTMIAQTGAPSMPDQVAFESESGAIQSADEVPPAVAWAGRLMMARARDDQSTFKALIHTARTDEEWTANCSAVLSMCALNIRRAKEASRG